MAHSERDSATRVEPTDGCPDCGARYADGWDARVDGNAKVYRNRHGEVVASVRFSCPECDLPLLLEEAAAAVVEVDRDRA